MTAYEKGEQEILARIRTLLALERNFLAEERTALAELRTGLTLALIGPPASAVVAFLLSLIPIEASIVLDLLNIAFFFTLTVAGIRMCLSSQSELKKIRKKKKLLKAREAEFAKNFKIVQNILGDLLGLEEEKEIGVRVSRFFI